MAQQPPQSPLPDPVLVAPLREATVVGRDLTLTWEPVVGADGYAVQVARDAGFADVVVEESVGRETLLRLRDVLPESRETFYWRVFALRGEAESPGEHVESFIAMTPDEVQAAPRIEPDTDEPFGPASKLFKAAGAEAAVEATGSDTVEQAVNQMGVEAEGVESAQILGITLSVLAVIIIIIIILFNWKATVRQQTYLQSVTQSGYPDLVEVEASAARRLGQYEVVNDAEGVYRVPIERVITMMSNTAAARRDSAATEELPLLDGR